MAETTWCHLEVNVPDSWCPDVETPPRFLVWLADQTLTDGEWERVPGAWTIGGNCHGGVYADEIKAVTDWLLARRVPFTLTDEGAYDDCHPAVCFVYDGNADHLFLLLGPVLPAKRYRELEAMTRNRVDDIDGFTSVDHYFTALTTLAADFPIDHLPAAMPPFPHTNEYRRLPMAPFVRTTKPIPVRHWAKADGTVTMRELPVGTLCTLVGDDNVPDTYMLVVADLNSEYHDDECWAVPEDAFEQKDIEADDYDAWIIGGAG